jgi:peroxiredoxin
MGAWGREQKATGIVRMMADGSATLTKALGLEFDLTEKAWACARNAIRCWSKTAWSSS